MMTEAAKGDLLDLDPELMALVGHKFSEVLPRLFGRPIRFYLRDIPGRAYEEANSGIDAEKMNAEIEHVTPYPGGVLGIWLTLYPYHPQSNFAYPCLKDFRGLTDKPIKVRLRLKKGIKKLKRLNYRHEYYLVVRQCFYDDHVSVLIVPPLPVEIASGFFVNPWEV